MKMIRFVNVIVAAGLIFTSSQQLTASADSNSERRAPSANAGSPGYQQKKDSFSQDDFSGLSYTAEQKAQIDKILRDTESRKAVVQKDEKLSQDQKDAMILGYSRLAYSAVFEVLTPSQQQQIRKKILARRRADRAAEKKQTSTN